MFWRLILGIVLNLAAALFAKAPKAPSAATLDEAGIPRADEGARVFDFAGTVWRRDPHVAWFGDFESRPIINRTGLFKSKKTTVGYVYFLGLHMVLCRQMDALLAIKMAKNDAWIGRLSSGRSGVYNGDLFGGEQREGGFSGEFDLMDGNPAQPINDYLASQLGALAAAYRGVVSIVWRKPYIGANSARLQPMEFKLLNVEGIHRGWQPSKAVIGLEGRGGASAIYIAMDNSASMTGTRYATQKAAIAGFLRALKGSVDTSVRVVVFNSSVATTNQRFDCTDDDFEDLALWVEALSATGGGTDYAAAVASAPTFFTTDASLPREVETGSLLDAIAGGSAGASRRKVVVFVTDGVPSVAGSASTAAATLATIPNVETYAFNIDETDTSFTEVIDNTPADGVPVVTGADPGALSNALAGAFAAWADVNPAHIIRALWTDPMRGGIAQESEIGDSFAAAADLFLAEGFGLSVPLRGADVVEADRLEVERHVDAVSYRSRRTGKIELKAIRNDYAPEDLPVLDSSIVLEWSGLERNNRGELPNQLTVIYTRRDTGETASVTRTNVAGVRRAGRVIQGEAVQYPFITRASIATRACLRDLSVQDRPLLAGTLRLAYLPPELEIGEPFILNEPLLGINNVVVRIMESQEGNGRDNSVTVQISEDRYALPDENTAGITDPPTPVPARPQASPFRVVQEAPYAVLVADTSQAEVDAALVTDPGYGRLLATGTKATRAHTSMKVAVDAGAGYTDELSAEFSVTALTLTALTSEADDVTVTIPFSTDLASVLGGSLAVIGTELVRVDSFAAAGADILVTLGRGCLDTVPVAHPIGTRIIFIDDAVPRETPYTAAAALDVKLLTKIGGRTLGLNTAPVDSVTFNSRAIRPFPPGRFKLNGSYVQDQLVGAGVLTWVNANRLTQSGAVPRDHDDAGVTAEAGTTYRVRVEALDATDAVISTLVDTNVGALLTYDWDEATVLPGGAEKVRFRVTSVRGGFESWQSPAIDAVLFLPPGDLEFEVL